MKLENGKTIIMPYHQKSVIDPVKFASVKTSSKHSTLLKNFQNPPNTITRMKLENCKD